MNNPYEHQVDLPVDGDKSLRNQLKKHLSVPENADRLAQQWLNNIVVTGGGDKPIRHFEIRSRIKPRTRRLIAGSPYTLALEGISFLCLGD